MILIDSPRFAKNTKKFAHLGSTESIDELHEFAKTLGVKKCWYHSHKYPHYDVNESLCESAHGLGAVKVSSAEFIRRSVGQ
jgi:hypothetical protein